MQFENEDDRDVLDFSPKYAKCDEENDNNSAKKLSVQSLADSASFQGLEFCSELVEEASEINTGNQGNQDNGLNDTLSVSSFNSSSGRLSISDISSDSTDSLLVLTPRSCEIVTRPDLPLFEKQDSFGCGVKQSVSDCSVNSNVNLENKFSSTSIDTVVEKINSDSDILDVEYPLERKVSTKLNFGQIDISGMATSSWMGPSFTKYVPIDATKCEFVPPCLHNQVYPAEWWELQACLTRQAFGAVVHTTSSDSSLQDRKKCGKKKSKKKLKRLFMCTAAQDSPLKPSWTQTLPTQREEILCEGVRTDSLEQPKSELPKLCSSRFNQINNENYLKVSSREEASFSATLYTPLPQDPNYRLCQYQTDMAATAMLTFFHPWSEIQCVWVVSLRTKLAELLHEGLALRPKFARSVRMCEFMAVLVVSEDAGVLIRHRDMNFLHSVAVSLGIETKHLLVLVREGPSCLGTAV